MCLSTSPTVPHRLQPASDPRPTVQGYGFRRPWSRRKLAGGWLRYVRDTICCHHRGAQHSVTGTSSSPQSNDVPVDLTNYLNDSSLTGSSSHGPRPQASGPTPPFHTGYNTFFPNSKHPSAPWSPLQAHGHLIDHYGYNHQTPQSGSTLSSELPRYPHTWANTDTQPVDMTHYYSPPQQSPVDASVENPPHRSSPFYVIPPNDTMGTIIQPANHQQDVVQYLDSRRPSFPQLYSPIPQQPAEYPTLPSPPRSNSSYSHPETSPLRPAQHMPQPVSSLWPTSYGRSSRSTSNSTHVTHAQNDVDSHSSIYSSDVVLSGNSSQVSHPAPLAQLPYLAEPTSYISQPRTDGPSFPVPQLAPSPAPTGGNRATRNYSYPQPGRQTRRVSRSGRQSEASGSRVRLDMLPPPAARRPRNENQTKVSGFIQALWLVVD